MFDAAEDSEASDGEIIPGDESQDEDTADDGEIFEADETEDVEPESEALILEDTIDDPDATDENAASDDTAVVDETDTASDETAADETEQPSDEDADVPEVEIVADSVDEFVSEGDFDELPTEDSDDEELFFVDEGEMESVSSEAMNDQEEQNVLFGINGGCDANCDIGNAEQILTYRVNGQDVSQAKENDEVTVVCNYDSTQYTLVRLTWTYNDVTNDLDLKSPMFTMPAGNVSIRARFTNRSVYSGDYGFNYVESHGSSSIAQVKGNYALSANAGDMVSVYVTEPNGWIYEGVTVTYGSTTLTLGADESFNMPAEEVTITPVLSPAHTGNYGIQVNGGPGGGGYAYVNNVRATSANENEIVELRINANYGYTLTGATVSYNGTTETLSADNMSFTMPAFNVTVTPTFTGSQNGSEQGGDDPQQPQTGTVHSITINCSDSHGTYVLSQDSAVAGTEITLTVTPDAGYKVSTSSSFTINSTGPNTFKFSMPNEDAVITLVYEEDNNSGNPEGGNTETVYSVRLLAYNAEGDATYNSNVETTLFAKEEGNTYFILPENPFSWDLYGKKVEYHVQGIVDNQEPGTRILLSEQSNTFDVILRTLEYKLETQINTGLGQGDDININTSVGGEPVAINFKAGDKVEVVLEPTERVTITGLKAYAFTGNEFQYDNATPVTVTNGADALHYSFDMPAANVCLVPEFTVQKDHTITRSSENGSFTTQYYDVLTDTADAGEYIQMYFQPESGYKYDGATVTYIGEGNTTETLTLTEKDTGFEMPDADVTVKVIFVPESNGNENGNGGDEPDPSSTVELSVYNNTPGWGSIAISGESVIQTSDDFDRGTSQYTAKAGSEITVTMTPETGHRMRLGDFYYSKDSGTNICFEGENGRETISGQPVSYTLPLDGNAHSIDVQGSFKVPETSMVVRFYGGEYGTLTVNGMPQTKELVEYPNAEKLTIVATPNVGYGALINGDSVDTEQEVVIGNDGEVKEVNVFFEPLSNYILIHNRNPEFGTVSVNGTQYTGRENAVEASNGEYTVTLTPNDGYRVWTGDWHSNVWVSEGGIQTEFEDKEGPQTFTFNLEDGYAQVNAYFIGSPTSVFVKHNSLADWGTVTINGQVINGNGLYTATVGEEITVTATPVANSHVNALSVQDGDNHYYPEMNGTGGPDQTSTKTVTFNKNGDYSATVFVEFSTPDNVVAIKNETLEGGDVTVNGQPLRQDKVSEYGDYAEGYYTANAGDAFTIVATPKEGYCLLSEGIYVFGSNDVDVMFDKGGNHRYTEAQSFTYTKGSTGARVNVRFAPIEDPAVVLARDSSNSVTYTLSKNSELFTCHNGYYTFIVPGDEAFDDVPEGKRLGWNDITNHSDEPYIAGEEIMLNGSHTKLVAQLLSPNAITFADSEHCQVSTDMQFAFKGDTVTVTVAPEDDYMVNHVEVRRTDGEGSSPYVDRINENRYTFTMPDGPVEVTAHVSTVNDGWYHIDTFEVGDHESGRYVETFIRDGSSYMMSGSLVTVNVNVGYNTNYEKLSVYRVSGSGDRGTEVPVTPTGYNEQTGAYTYTFTMPKSEVELVADFTFNGAYNIKIDRGEDDHGSVTARFHDADVSQANEDDWIELRVVPDVGWRVGSVSVTGESGDIEVEDYAFNMPGEDITVKATFVEVDPDTTYDEDIALTAANFPDANLRGILEDYDTNEDGYLSPWEIVLVNDLYFDHQNTLSDATGIKLLIKLHNLKVIGSYALTSLDVSGMEELFELEVNSCASLTSLNITGCDELEVLLCFDCNLQKLDLDGCSALLKIAKTATPQYNGPNGDDYANYYGMYGNRICIDKDTQLRENGAAIVPMEGVVLNATNFPDAQFRAYLSNLFHRGDGAELSAQELVNVTWMSLVQTDPWGEEIYDGNGETIPLGVADLTGIEHFPFLEELDCHGNRLTTLDLSHNANLRKVCCDGNQLTELITGDNPNLEEIWCDGNRLTSLDVSGCVNLEKLNCSENQLTELNLSGLSKLEELFCCGNQLGTLDASDCTNLVDLNCGDNKLKALDVSVLTNLEALVCYNNGLSSLDVSKCAALTILDFEDNDVAAIDLSHNESLTVLWCGANNLTTLDVSGLSDLEKLDCSGNELSTLNVKNNPKLEFLHCEYNELTKLDLWNCPELVEIYKETPDYIRTDAEDGDTHNSWQYCPFTNDEGETYYLLSVDEGVVVRTVCAYFENEPEAKTGLVYNGTAQALVTAGTATTEYGGTLYYKLNDGEWSTEIPTAIDAGNYNVYFKVTGMTGAEVAQYAEEMPVTVEIARKSLSVKPENRTKAYGDVDPELTYTVIDGQLVDGDTLTGALTRAEGKDVGTYAIMQGTLTAGDNYEIILSDAALSIIPKPLTVTAENKSKIYGDDDPELTWTAPDLVDGDTLTGALTRAEGKDVGDYAITQGTLSATDNYTLSFVSGTLTICKKALTVTAENKSKTYGAVDPALTWTAPDLVDGDTLTGVLTRAEGENAGNYAITQGTLTATGNYDMTFIPGTLTINLAKLTVTAMQRTKIYGEKDPKLTYTVEGLVGNDKMSGALTRTMGEDVGAYDIEQGTLTAGDNDNYTIDYTGAKLTVTPATLTVTADTLSKAYGENNPELTYTVTGLANGDIKEDVLKGALTREEGENAGEYAIEQGTLTVGGNYTLSFTDGVKFTVRPKKITVVANAATKVYGAEDPTLTYTVVGGQQDALTGTLERVEGEAVGSYAIKRGSLETENANYELIFQTARLTITPATLTVTADTLSKVYGENDPELTYTVTGLANGDIKEDVLTGELAREAGENAGGYAITQGTLAVGDNYTMAFTPGTLTIGKRALTVTPNAVEKTYGETDPALTYTVSGELAGSDALTGALGREVGETVGEYAITRGTLSVANSDNYDIELGKAEGKDVVLTINKRQLTINADAKAKLKDAATDPELTYTVTGLAQGDVATVTLTRDAGEDVGAYSIGLTNWSVKKGDVDVTGCYEQTFNGANLTIGDNVINVTAKDVSKVYGAEDPELAYTVGGEQQGALTGALGRVEGENAGTYAITQGTLQPNAGYVLNFVGANLTIEKAKLTVTPDDQEKTYGEADPELTYTVSGLVNGDAAEAVLTGDLARAAGEAVNENGYAIEQGTLAPNNNYTLTVEDGKTLSIAPKTLTVTAKDAEKTYGADDPIFGYDVEGLVGNDTAATVLTGALGRAEGKDVGEYDITQGTLKSNSDNYTVGTFEPAKLTIVKKDITVKVTGTLSKTYGKDDPVFGYVDTNNAVVTDSPLTIGREAGGKVGRYAFTADNANYNVTFKDGDEEQWFEIRPKEITELTWSEETLEYNGSSLKPTASFTGLESGDACYVNVDVIEGDTTIDAVDAGSYTAWAVSLTNPNYKLPNDLNIIQKTFNIVKAPGENRTVGREVTVSFHGVRDARVDLSKYLADAESWSVKHKDELITEAVPDGKALVYSTMDTEGTEITTGSVVINVVSKNYENSTLTVNFRTSEAFALRFESNGGPQEASRSLAAEDKIMEYLPEAAMRDGYVLKGWYLDAALTDPVSDYNTMGEADATVYAKWEPITYTIQLTDPEGYHDTADDDNLNPVAYTVETNRGDARLTLPILKDVKSGSLSFTFVGWKELGEEETVEPRLDVTIDPASMVNTTYVAQWKQGEVAGKVSFDNAGGGNGLQGVQGMNAEASTDDDAPTTSLANAMKAIANEDMTEETADSKITVEMSISASTKDAEAKDAIKDLVTSPQAEGVTQSTDFMEISITSTTTVTVEGQEQEPEVLDQRHVSNAGRVVEIPLKYDMTGRYNPVMTRHHRDEDGKTSTITLNRLSRRPSGNEMEDGTFYIEGSGANAIVYVYSQLFSTLGMTYDDSGELQVYFDYNNGDAPIEKVVHENEMLARPAEDPVREGDGTYAYVFDKWYMDKACKTPYNFDAPVTRNNMTIYAGWKRYAIVDVKVEGFSGTYDAKEHEIKVEIQNDNPDIDIYFSEEELTKDNYTEGSKTVQPETMPTEVTYHWYADATDCVANPASGVVSIDIKKVVSTVTAVPRAQSLTYNGSAQALVSAGKATGGTLKYALGSNSSIAPAGGWSTNVPTAANAGTYYVWYKVEGTSIYADAKPVCVTVTIATPAAQTVQAAPASAPEPEPIPTIPVLKKKVKATISAAPGSVYQIELGGVTGKSFKSSKKKVATVSATGLITVKAAGKTKITLKAGKKKRTLTLTVKDPTIPNRIALNVSGSTAVKVGESQTLTVTLPEGTESGIKWKSSNKKIATVNNGVVTFKKAGKVTITATAVRGKKKAKVKFAVSK